MNLIPRCYLCDKGIKEDAYVELVASDGLVKESKEQAQLTVLPGMEQAWKVFGSAHLKCLKKAEKLLGGDKWRTRIGKRRIKAQGSVKTKQRKS